jgi:hypothetical protein
MRLVLMCVLVALWGAVVLAGCGAPGSCGDLAHSPATHTSGPVTIATDHTTYPRDGFLNVTVANGGQEPIYAWDHNASCSILTLQVEVSGAWQPPRTPIAGCALGRPTVAVQIAPGASYHATIGPGYLDVRQGAFDAGTYRLALTYYPGQPTGPAPNPGGPRATTIYSQTLTVRDCTAGGATASAR